MAAHIVTFLKEAIELDEKGKFDQAQHDLFQDAIDNAQLGDQLDYPDDWRGAHCMQPNVFIEYIKSILPKYEKRWEELGRPETVEKWKEIERSNRGIR